jgi:hypothetical protein
MMRQLSRILLGVKKKFNAKGCRRVRPTGDGEMKRGGGVFMMRVWYMSRARRAALHRATGMQRQKTRCQRVAQ